MIHVNETLDIREKRRKLIALYLQNYSPAINFIL